jgi:hypothetical protein
MSVIFTKIGSVFLIKLPWCPSYTWHPTFFLKKSAVKCSSTAMLFKEEKHAEFTKLWLQDNLKSLLNKATNILKPK